MGNRGTQSHGSEVGKIQPNDGRAAEERADYYEPFSLEKGSYNLNRGLGEMFRSLLRGCYSAMPKGTGSLLAGTALAWLEAGPVNGAS